MSRANVQQTVRRVDKLRNDLVALRFSLSRNVCQSERVLECASDRGAMRLQSPDEMKADIAEEIQKLKIDILDVKIARLNDVLSELRSLSSQDKPPHYLTIIGYENWVQSNEILYELQSRLIAIQSEKRRLRLRERLKESGTEPRVLSISIDEHFHARRQKQLQQGTLVVGQTDSKLSEMRLQLRSLLGRSRPTDLHSMSELDVTFREGQKSFLDELVSLDPSNPSFEGRKLREYVAECWKEDTLLCSLSRNSMGAHPDRYQDYIQALCDYIVDYQFTHHEKELTFNSVHSKVESSLMPAIRTLCLQHVQARANDEAIHHQCVKYRGVTQSQMGIPKQFQSQEVVPFADAISKLKASYFSVTPGQKLYDIISAANAVFQKVGEDSDEPVGADIFMDIWCYIVIKANIQDLATTLAFISDYCNPTVIQGQAGYFLSSLQLAAQYVMALSDDNLQASERIEQFVTCDISAYRRFCVVQDSPFVLSGDIQELKGYTPYVIKEWYFDPSRLCRAVLVPSDLESVAYVAVVKVRSGLPTSQDDYIRDVISCHLLKGTGCQTLHTPLGPTVGLPKITDLQQGLSLVSLSNGCSDDSWQLVETCLTLERLAVPLPTSAYMSSDQISATVENPLLLTLTDDVTCSMDKKFRSDFGTPFNVSLSLVIRPIIQVCQVMLQHLGYLTTLADADGTYSDLLLKAVCCFQISYNESMDGGLQKKEQLRVDGKIDKLTYEALHLSLQSKRLRMERLGLVCNADPCSVSCAHTFRRFITECQKAWGLTRPVYGTLDKATLAEIERQLKLLNPNSSWV
ncbi:uncharacterized protein LOC134195377 [Corticium candelabrum]|uniref:uncharacterized protein LOC134195377 n=1 Tax=Corticium candelabrum TaxID=121492 RepID=UPI002E25563C|nr:uncharacterized protein LOC134195377 [Corticium candelabrum]